MDLGISGRTAVVGGASSGLGRASAMRLAEAGCKLLVWARHEGPLLDTAKELRRAGSPTVETVIADASSADAAAIITEAVTRHFSGADIVVLNAGGPPPSDATVSDPDALRSALQLLVETPIDLASRLLPGMRERGWGRIAAVLSWGVREPVPALPYSNIGRSGLAAWLKTTSVLVGPDGVTINGVLPGRFATPRLEIVDASAATRAGISFDAARRRAWAEIPAGRDGDPDEFGAVVAFFCSQPAAYLNGAFVPVDGGMLKSLG
ncbi:MAG: SDR family oxidoreductase [Chloroflexota bacterium]